MGRWWATPSAQPDPMNGLPFDAIIVGRWGTMWENSAGTSPAAADSARAMKLPTAPIGRNPNAKELPQVVHPGGAAPLL